MFGLAEYRKALVSQLSDSLCFQDLTQHYSGMAKQKKKSLFLSHCANKHSLNLKWLIIKNNQMLWKSLQTSLT